MYLFADTKKFLDVLRVTSDGDVIPPYVTAAASGNKKQQVNKPKNIKKTEKEQNIKDGPDRVAVLEINSDDGHDEDYEKNPEEQIGPVNAAIMDCNVCKNIPSEFIMIINVKKLPELLATDCFEGNKIQNLKIIRFSPFRYAGHDFAPGAHLITYERAMERTIPKENCKF